MWKLAALRVFAVNINAISLSLSHSLTHSPSSKYHWFIKPIINITTFTFRLSLNCDILFNFEALAIDILFVSDFSRCRIFFIGVAKFYDLLNAFKICDVEIYHSEVSEAIEKEAGRIKKYDKLSVAFIVEWMWWEEWRLFSAQKKEWNKFLSLASLAFPQFFRTLRQISCCHLHQFLLSLSFCLFLSSRPVNMCLLGDWVTKKSQSIALCRF